MKRPEYVRRGSSQRRVVIGAAVLVVVAVTAVLAITWWLPRHRLSAARASWQPPPDAVLSEPMEHQPIPGWRTKVADLGLPPTADSALAVGNRRVDPEPFIGSVGPNAYFLAYSGPDGERQWWLVGIDVHSGKPLFDPVALGSDKQIPECFLNGPTHVLCLDGAVTDTAWVIDGRSGAVDYSGRTDLQSGFGVLGVHQVGLYAVATQQNQGVYGIGPHAETTWFVPGDGSVRTVESARADASSQTLTGQLEANPRTYVFTVFSVVDGRVITPEIDKGYTLGEPVFYTGGFAAEVSDPDGIPSEIVFFDATGKRLSGYDGRGSFSDSPIDLPVVSIDETRAAYSALGEKLLEIPAGGTRLVGATLMVNLADSADFPEWQQYDVKTGTQGPVCDFPMSHYLGHHGSTLVVEYSYHDGEVLMAARDMTTCERLWVLPKRPGSLDRIWRIDGTIVQLTGDGTELRSLVAPG